MSAALLAAVLLASGQAAGPAQQPAPDPQPSQTQTTREDAPAPAADAQADPAPTAGGPQGTTPYPAAFFSSFQPSNAAEMLGRVPGLVIDYGDDVRGFGGAVGNVLIDGERPSVKGDELANLVRRIPAGQVERVDLIRGGAPGIDMAGKPVVVNIVRRAGAGTSSLQAFAFQLTGDGRFHPALRLETSRRAPGRSFEASMLLFAGEPDNAGEGEQIARSGVGNLLFSGPYEVDTTYDGIELRGSGELRAGRNTFRANGDYQLVNEDSHERADFINANGQSAGFDRSGYAFHRDRGSIGGDWSRPLTSTIAGTLIFLQRLEDEHLDAFSDGQGDPVRFVEDSLSGETILRGRATWTRSPSLSVEFGAEGAFNFLDGQTALTVAGEPVVLPSANVRVEELRGEVFSTATWRPMPRLSVEIGARVETSTISQTGDVDQERTFTFFKPRLNLGWTPDPDTSVRLRLEREVGQLDFGDFVSSTSVSDDTVNAGNPDLEPERAWVAELALERRFWGRGSAVLTLTHAEVEAVADLVPIQNRFDAPGNIGEGTRDTARVQLTLPLDRLGISQGLFTGFTEWRRSSVTDPLTGEERRITSQSPFRWEARYSQDVSRWNLSYGVDVFGGFEEVFYRINEIRRVEYEDFVNLYTEWRPRPNLQLRFELQNVLARDRSTFREFFDGPRNLNRLSGTELRRVEYPTAFYFRIRRTL